MSIEAKANQVLKYAKELKSCVKTWADFSNALFDPVNGRIASTFPAEMERQAFYDSKQYEEINKILEELIKKFGTAGGATPEKSGKFVVRVAKSLHRSLEIEAKQQGVSLNQLANTKLAMPLETGDISNLLVVEAFAEIHEGFAADAVIVQPEYNARFIEACRSRGLQNAERELNHVLMRIRKMDTKSKARHGIVMPPTTQRLTFNDYDDYAYASEIAVRVLQRTENTTLDRILCDPKLREHFDSLARELVSGISEIKLRCAALNLRKTHRLKPLDDDAPEYTLTSVGPLKRLNLDDVDTIPGTYAFFDSTRPIFAGETRSLRKRVERHLDRGLPEWLRAMEEDTFILKVAPATEGNQDTRRSWLQNFINREKPLLNYQQVA